MFRAFFKLVVLAIAVLILLQLEYNGRKIQTYVVEYFKSLRGKKEIVYIKEEPSDNKTTEDKKVESKVTNKKTTDKKEMASEKTIDKKHAAASKKTIDSEKKKIHKDKKNTEVKKVKMVKEKADDQPDITDADRKELQQILE
ncbi:MAG: hypothetical protein WCQ47_06320 [bacterium]